MNSNEVNEKKETLANEMQFLTFLVQGEMFAVGIESVREILNYKVVAKIPLAPDFIHGVLNLRGVVIPVIDLAARLHHKISQTLDRSSVLILEVKSLTGLQIIGVLVDSVSEVLGLDLSKIEAPPQFGAHLRSDFIKGITKINNRFIIILNNDAVFSIEEMSTFIGCAEKNNTSNKTQNDGTINE